MGYISSKLVHAALSAAALCLGASSAGAVQYTVTYTGVASGTDRFGFFGVGTNFTGQNATIQYVVDTARGGSGTDDRQVLQGSSGSPFIYDLQPLYVIMTIGSMTKIFDYPTPQGAGGSVVSIYNNADRTGPSASGGRNTSYNERLVTGGIIRSDSSVSTFVTLGTAGSTNPSFFDRSISAPFDLALSNPTGFAYGSASFLFNTYNQQGGILDRQVSGNVTLNRITVGPLAAAVPEPTTWAMLIGGFGMIGGAARRSRTLSSWRRVVRVSAQHA